MEQKEIKINCPEGFEIDKENSTFECIKFKLENKLPKTWKEFCKNSHRRIGESWISDDSAIETIEEQDSIVGNTKESDFDKNLLPSKKLAEAMLALCQLIQLRDCYNDGWVPDYQNDHEFKYCIIILSGMASKVDYTSMQRVLTFKTAELRDQFLENFKDLIEIAEPLL